MMRRRHLALILAVAAMAAPAGVCAQTILGQVLDQVNEQPVGGVVVSLVARSGEEQLRTLSDSVGRFVIQPTEAGEYLLITERFGYLETRSPLLALTTEGRAPLELLIAPSPIGLEGIEITVEESAVEQLSVMGLSANVLGRRWIDREQIEAIQVKRDMGVILENTAQSGVRIVRPDNLTMGSEDMGLCVSMQRARTFIGRETCALVVLNGVPISGVQAINVDPQAIESIAVLIPIEARIQYGRLGTNGAVLVWTRHGR